METNQGATCSTCSKPLPNSGFFCGVCLTQFKCKECEHSLEKDYAGCINCGTPRWEKQKSNNVNVNANTFKLHETLTERTIEATFSDDVAKDLAGTLRDAAAAGRTKTIAPNILPSNNSNGRSETVPEFTEAEVLNNEDTITKAEAINKSPSDETSKATDYPTLRAIAMKNLPATETEWIVVYAFYSSNYGVAEFSRQNIIEKYSESNRKNKDRIKGLSAYITAAVRGGYINPLEDSFSILDKGVDKAKEIIGRTSSSSPKVSRANGVKAKKEDADKEGSGSEVKAKTNKKKTATASKTYKTLANIDFYPSGKDSLKDFIKKFSVKNDNEKNLLFVYYLTEILKIPEISLDHLYTCYDETGKISENVAQSLANTKSRTKWLETDGNSNIQLTVKGKNKIRFWDKADSQ